MIKYSKTNLNNAKNLRKDMTPWERKLYYSFLKDLEYKFYKQRLIDNYILDFYCGRLKLAIELDGSQHYFDKSIEYDNQRTNYLNSIGITVLRFTNIDIDRKFNEVCEQIYHTIQMLSKKESN